MRCAACDRGLSDLDSSRKSPITGQYYDLCGRCFKTIEDQVEFVENRDLSTIDESGFNEGDIDDFEDKPIS